MYSYPNLKFTWTISKPLFCKKFNVVSIQNTFINKVAKLTISSCENNSVEYFWQVNNTIHGEKELFISPIVDYPANSEFTAA